MTDLEIANKSEKRDIREIAKSLGLKANDLICYSTDKAKITVNRAGQEGKLILVTAINPTPFGEGKTTVSIGLGDALHNLNKKFFFQTLNQIPQFKYSLFITWHHIF